MRNRADPGEHAVFVISCTNPPAKKAHLEPVKVRVAPLVLVNTLDPLFDDVEKRTFNFFWDTAEPGDRPDAGPLAEAAVLEHRRGGLRAHRLLHRRGARLRHARPGARRAC